MNIWEQRHLQIIGLMRVRDEGLILEDSLNHFSRIVDGIIVYDDVSSDDTVRIAASHPKVLKVIVGDE